MSSLNTNATAGVIYDHETELGVLGCLFEENLRQDHIDSLVADDFFDPACRSLFGLIARLHDLNERISMDRLITLGADTGLLVDCGKYSVFSRVTADIFVLKRDSARRHGIEDAKMHLKRILEEPDYLGAPVTLERMLDSRRFDILNRPEKPIPVLAIGGKTIATAGNLIAVTAQAKAGKTATLAAMMAATMEPTGDCLGISGQNPEGLAVVHFDTEQSGFDYFSIVSQMLKRAGREQPPTWFRSYWLTGESTKVRRESLAQEMKRAARGGKLCAVFLDGGADLCVDPNNPAEAFSLVEELHRLAITYNCPIICVLHENPGTETGKTRGHLGSQLERKAETNLRLSKDSDGITTIFTEKSRHCHIPKELGPRFAWDEAAGMHISVETGNAVKLSAKLEQLKRVIVDIFAAASKPSFRHRELVEAIQSHQSCSERTAKTRIDEAVSNGFVRHESGMGLYSRGQI